MEKLKTEIPEIKLHFFETWHNADNLAMLAKIGKETGFDISGVPVLIIGNQAFPGFYNEETTGKQIRLSVEEALKNGCIDVVAQVLGLDNEENEGDIEKCEQKSELPEKINIPIIGEIEIKNFSLPALTILIGALDGFNPCAMWVLVFLISMLLGMKDRKKMWILGSAFIVTSSLVYFVFLSAWLHLFLFLGFIIWIRLGISVVALGSGFYHLKEYFKNKKGVCRVTKNEKRRAIFSKLKDVIERKNFLMALIGIILLAAAVNLVELICSAGLPAIYTQVLTMSDLPRWQYYVYLVLYIFVFMLDDLFVFFIAMVTLRMELISSKYTRWSNLIGGIIMIIIGLLLIFNPGWLMFG